jgi:hypothetical protein
MSGKGSFPLGNGLGDWFELRKLFLAWILQGVSLL